MADVPIIAGLEWCLAGLLAAFVALIGLVLQALVLVARAPRGERARHLRAAVLGPLAGVVIGLLLAASIDLFDADTKLMLDRVFFVPVLAAAGAWFAINRSVIRKLNGPAPTKVRRPAGADAEKVE